MSGILLFQHELPARLNQFGLPEHRYELGIRTNANDKLGVRVHVNGLKNLAQDTVPLCLVGLPPGRGERDQLLAVLYVMDSRWDHDAVDFADQLLCALLVGRLVGLIDQALLKLVVQPAQLGAQVDFAFLQFLLAGVSQNGLLDMLAPIGGQYQRLHVFIDLRFQNLFANLLPGGSTFLSAHP